MYASQNHFPNSIETVAWSDTRQLWLSLCTKRAFVQNLTIPNLLHLTSKTLTSPIMHFRLITVAFSLLCESVLHRARQCSVFYDSAKAEKKGQFTLSQNDIRSHSTLTPKEPYTKGLFGLLLKELRWRQTPVLSVNPMPTAQL